MCCCAPLLGCGASRGCCAAVRRFSVAPNTMQTAAVLRPRLTMPSFLASGYGAMSRLTRAQFFSCGLLRSPWTPLARRAGAFGRLIYAVNPHKSRPSFWWSRNCKLDCALQSLDSADFGGSIRSIRASGAAEAVAAEIAVPTRHLRQFTASI